MAHTHEWSCCASPWLPIEHQLDKWWPQQGLPLGMESCTNCAAAGVGSGSAHTVMASDHQQSNHRASTRTGLQTQKRVLHACTRIRRTIWIKAFAFSLDVEHITERVRISETPSHVLPAKGITLEVCIQEHIPEVLQPPLPWQQQVLHQERCSEHTGTIVHPPSHPQLAHRGINDGVSCQPLAPCTETCWAVYPGDCSNMLQQRPLVCEREVERQVTGILSVAQLLQKVLHSSTLRLSRRKGLSSLQRLVVYHSYLQCQKWQF